MPQTSQRRYTMMDAVGDSGPSGAKLAAFTGHESPDMAMRKEQDRQQQIADQAANEGLKVPAPSKPASEPAKETAAGRLNRVMALADKTRTNLQAAPPDALETAPPPSQDTPQIRPFEQYLQDALG